MGDLAWSGFTSQLGDTIQPMFGLFRKKKNPVSPYLKIEDSNVFKLRVKTKIHHEVVELRFTKSADIGAADDGGYIYRKTIVSPTHFERGEVAIHFGPGYTLTEMHTQGCDPIPLTEWS